MNITEVKKYQTPDRQLFDTIEAAERHIENKMLPLIDDIFKRYENKTGKVLPAGFLLYLCEDESNGLSELKTILNKWI